MNKKQIKKYIVTKASKNLAFQVGDVISFDADGTINDHTNNGWIDAADLLKESTEGMEYKLLSIETKITYDENKWKLMPIDPTEEMLDLLELEIDPVKAYKLLIDAAPQP